MSFSELNGPIRLLHSQRYIGGFPQALLLLRSPPSIKARWSWRIHGEYLVLETAYHSLNTATRDAIGDSARIPTCIPPRRNSVLSGSSNHGPTEHFRWIRSNTPLGTVDGVFSSDLGLSFALIESLWGLGYALGSSSLSCHSGIQWRRFSPRCQYRRPKTWMAMISCPASKTCQGFYGNSHDITCSVASHSPSLTGMWSHLSVALSQDSPLRSVSWTMQSC